MAKTWINKVAQTDVPFRFTLTENGRPFDATDYSSPKVNFYTAAGTLLFTRDAVWVSQAAGIIEYAAWVSGDPIDTAGSYAATFTITKTSTSKPRTFPSTGRIPITIEA